MVWSLETDDFRGKCFNEKYPLLTAMARKLNGDSVVQQTVPPEERATKDPEPVKPTAYPGQEFQCTKAGYFRDPKDCSKFYLCVEQGQGEFARHSYTCGENSAFDESTTTCTFRDKVPGCS